MVGLSSLFWSTLGLAVVLSGVTVALLLEIVRGHVAVRIPWGRRFYPLEERLQEIDAPRSVVVDLLRAAARGATPGLTREERCSVVDEQDGLIVNESITPSVYGPVEAMELVRVEPDRVTYRHLSGPLPGTEEEFVLGETDGRTTVTYRGRIPISFWGLGGLVAKALVLPEYNRLIGVHMDALKRTAEGRAGRRRREGSP
jgi:hypothetical protein